MLDWPLPVRWALTGAFFCFVNWLMLAPGETFEDIHVFLAHQDKLAHLGIFLSLALLVHWSLPPAYRGGWRRVAAIGALVGYAGSVELAQPLLTRASRQYERLDLVCNFVGVAAGWLLFGAMAARSQDRVGEDRTA